MIKGGVVRTVLSPGVDRCFRSAVQEVCGAGPRCHWGPRTNGGVKAVITADWAEAATEGARLCDAIRREVMNHCDAVVTAFARTHINVLLLYYV